jgi:predicted Zn-dependent protease
VRFVDRFASGISGKTVWSRDNGWWLISSDIQLALSHPGGGTVSPPQIRAIALHEVGHLLGLDHSAAPDHIMSARIRVRELTDADRATVRLLYSIPAGTLR